MVKDIVIRQRTGQFETLPTCRGCAGSFERVAPRIGLDQNERPDNRKRTQMEGVT